MVEAEIKYQTTGTSNQVLLILLGGTLSSIACTLSTCAAKLNCEQNNTCVSDGGYLCSFSNRVGIKEDVVYKLNATAQSLSSLLRGLCGPGDRTHKNKYTNTSECAPYYPFPSAINHEIMDPGGFTPAERACGKWMQTSNDWTRIERRGAHGNDEWMSDVSNAEEAATSSFRTGHTDMSKFRTECRRTTSAGSGALRAAMVLNFKRMQQYIDTVVIDRAGFLRFLGFHMSHFCEGPARASIVPNGAFNIMIYDGWPFSKGVMSSSLRLLEQSLDVQEGAEEANRAINSAFYNESVANLTVEERTELMLGASDGRLTSFRQLEANTSLIKAALEYYDTNSSKAIAYAKGLAAFCSYEMYAFFEDYEHTPSVILSDVVLSEVRRIKETHVPASSLGKITPPNSLVDHVGANEISESTSVTLASVVADGGTGIGSEDCVEMMRKFFLDEIEETRFAHVVPRHFYAKLQSMVSLVRSSVVHVAKNSFMKFTMTDPNRYAQIVQQSEIRIVGAPRGSWAGKAREIPRAGFTSTDGMFTMLSKQARAVFTTELSNLASTHVSASQCDHNAPFPQLSWNAYAVRLGDWYCSVYFLGMAHRPLLDPLYDNSSLYARGLFVLAHELAHHSQLADLTHDSMPAVQSLLRYYHPVTHSEAYADVFAAVAILSTGRVSRQEFTTHHCQVWCARQPSWFSQPLDQVHPIGNDRCNFLVKTLDEFFPTLGNSLGNSSI